VYRSIDRSMIEPPLRKENHGPMRLLLICDSKRNQMTSLSATELQLLAKYLWLLVRHHDTISCIRCLVVDDDVLRNISRK